MDSPTLLISSSFLCKGLLLMISSQSWLCWQLNSSMPPLKLGSIHLFLLHTARCLLSKRKERHKITKVISLHILPSSICGTTGNQVFYYLRLKYTTPTRQQQLHFQGVACSGIAFCLTSWTIQKRGHLYASAFTPLLLIIVVVSNWIFYQEKL